MIKKTTNINLIPISILIGMLILFIGSFIRGSIIVQKSEKEFSPKKEVIEALTKTYNLKEIDGKTGFIKWELRAKEGQTENNLDGVLIKDIEAKVYKDNEIAFNLFSPYARANAKTKEIYLFGNVMAKDKNNDFFLTANQLVLGMGTEVEAQKGFTITLKDTSKIIGENALINNDQTKITIKKLEEGTFKDIVLSGEKVYLERNQAGELINATISNFGKIIIKNSNNDTLSAKTIKWKKDNEIEAIENVVFLSNDKKFNSSYLVIKPDKSIYAKNNVSITHGKTNCQGNILTYENNIAVISGKPKAYQDDKEIHADKIIYNINTNKLEAQGNVRTTVLNTQKKPKKNA